VGIPRQPGAWSVVIADIDESLQANDQQQAALADGVIRAIGLRPIDPTTQHALTHEVCESLTLLTPLELQVLACRFGLGDGANYSRPEVGRKLRLSDARVKHIEERALQKLRMVIPLAQLRFVGSPSELGWPVQWAGPDCRPRSPSQAAAS